MAKHRDERDRRKADAERVLANHKMVPEVSRSFYFRSADPKMGTCYAFALTWRPGSLVLSGDCGELTLTHWHAMSDFKSGLEWALQGDFDYLLSKSDKRQEFDRDGTVNFIVQHLNEPVVEALNGYTDHFAKRRRDGLRQELHRWRRDGSDPEEDPREEHRFAPSPRYEQNLSAQYGNTPIDQLYDIPDYWSGWVRAWKKLVAGSYITRVDDPTVLLFAKGRREVKDEIEGHCETEHEAADLCSRLGLDDYYGSRAWSSHNLFQIAVIQHGVRMILAEATSEQAAQAA